MEKGHAQLEKVLAGKDLDDNLVKIAMEKKERVELEYQNKKQGFERASALIGELADVLNAPFPDYVVEVDKELKYKQMVISNKVAPT
jgi:hypothetical protein